MLSNVETRRGVNCENMGSTCIAPLLIDCCRRDALFVHAEDAPQSRALHYSTFQLNLSTFCGMSCVFSVTKPTKQNCKAQIEVSNGP